MNLKTFIKPGWGLPLMAVCLLATIAFAPHRTTAAQVKYADFQELDTVIATQMQKHGLPGVAVAVIEYPTCSKNAGTGT